MFFVLQNANFLPVSNILLLFPLFVVMTIIDNWHNRSSCIHMLQCGRRSNRAKKMKDGEQKWR